MSSLPVQERKEETMEKFSQFAKEGPENQYTCPFCGGRKGPLSIKTDSTGRVLFWKCPICGVFGKDVVDYVAKLEDISKDEAAEQIAEKVEVPKRKIYQPRFPERRIEAKIIKAVAAIHMMVREAMDDRTDGAEQIRRYLDGWRISKEAVRSEALGAWTEEVLDKAIAEIEEEVLLKLGILQKGAEESTPAFTTPALAIPIIQNGELVSVCFRPLDGWEYILVNGKNISVWGEEALYDKAQGIYLTQDILEAIYIRQSGKSALSLVMVNKAKQAAEYLSGLHLGDRGEFMYSIETIFHQDEPGRAVQRDFIMTAIGNGKTALLVMPEWGNYPDKEEPITDLYTYLATNMPLLEDAMALVGTSQQLTSEEYLASEVKKGMQHTIILMRQFLPSRQQGESIWINAIWKATSKSKKDAEIIVKEVCSQERLRKLTEEYEAVLDSPEDDEDGLLVTGLRKGNFTPLANPGVLASPAMGMTKCDGQGIFYYSLPLLGLENGDMKYRLLVVNNLREEFIYESPEQTMTKLGVLFPSDLPVSLKESLWNNRWEPKLVVEYIDGKTVEAKVVFERIKEKLTEFVDLECSEIEEIVTLWLMAGYVHVLFDAFPYLFINGEMGSGKSRLMDFMEKIAFNAATSASTTIALLLRIIDTTGAVCLLDEMEFLTSGNGEQHDAPLRLVLQAGYKKGAQATRAAKEKSKWEGIIRYDIYSPKAFASIGLLERTLRSRCIIVNMLRSTDKKKMQKSFSFEPKKTWDGIRSDLYGFGLDYALAIEEFIKQYDDLDIYPDDILGRDAEILVPILAVAKTVDNSGELNKRIITWLMKEPPASTLAEWKENLLILFDKWLKEKNNASYIKVTPGEIMDRYNEEYGVKPSEFKFYDKNVQLLPQELEQSKVMLFCNRLRFDKSIGSEPPRTVVYTIDRKTIDDQLKAYRLIDDPSAGNQLQSQLPLPVVQQPDHEQLIALLEQFLDEECMIGKGYWESSDALCKAFVAFCERNGMNVDMSNKQFGKFFSNAAKKELAEFEFEPESRAGGQIRGWQGLRLIDW